METECRRQSALWVLSPPVPLASLAVYSTEDFLQILGVFPLAIHFVLSGVEWDTEKENTMAVHKSMEISFELQEREEETADGEKVVAFFQKREVSVMRSCSCSGSYDAGVRVTALRPWPSR